MGKRPRTPHFITGIGDGHVHSSMKQPHDELRLQNKERGNNGNNNLRRERYIRTRNERLVRLEEPLAATDQWRDVFGSEDPDMVKASNFGFLPFSPYAILGFLIIITALLLHLVSDSSNEPNSKYRRRQRRMYRTRKKKTDEWSDDEEEILKSNYLAHENEYDFYDNQQETYYPHYYDEPAVAASIHSSSHDEHRRRRSSFKEQDSISPKVSGGYIGASNYYMPQQGQLSAYRSPAANMMDLTPTGVHRRGGASPLNSFSQGPSPIRRTTLHPFDTPTSISGSGRETPGLLGSPSAAKTLMPTAHLQSFTGSSSHSHVRQGSSHNAELPRPAGTTSAVVRPLSSNFSSFETLTGDVKQSGNYTSDSSMDFNQIHPAGSYDLGLESSHGSGRLQVPMTPARSAATPLMANVKKTIDVPGDNTPGFDAAMMPPSLHTPGREPRIIPFIPSLDASKHSKHPPHANRLLAPRPAAAPPPHSMSLEDLRLVQMETGSSEHWKQMSQHISERDGEDDFYQSFNQDESEAYPSDGSSDVSIPSGDPRKSIVHKRKKLTNATNATASLQGYIHFDELKLVEVIGGGGFGQVWRASWRGTPVAVKVLTGGAQNQHVAKSILEEFKAEINLLKGMRHPNICLYMGACVHPPNRAIITELAANGSVWDALRLPLTPPYVPSDGTPAGSWPIGLYLPGEIGTPPRADSMMQSPHTAPLIPRGTWPWELAKRVASGAARGMVYLHSGSPPVLHRDLKSANLLLDESYNAKVCDFGLSRIKAQERSMTGNCGTVQWMAPEVLANLSYNEKADVYSYGIIVWELLSRECPYDGMSPIQCALAVLNRDKRPDIPKWCPPQLHALIKSCTKKDPAQRPSFDQILLALDAMNG
ncbi:unnamed protein product [Cylindrotheca closterium]|uniref:Protein kinase domain-containing protein n=1 Tax=Cylindrotheca closterium TaxID=2856 RepID=A0AAD2FLQ7_9STRA|nr:unnamed protein product [Cylindrotheca closterium]